jgi:hypothetical protein
LKTFSDEFVDKQVKFIKILPLRINPVAGQTSIDKKIPNLANLLADTSKPAPLLRERSLKLSVKL